MKKFWTYLSTSLLGVILGMILHWLLVRSKISNTQINVKKVKQKNATDSIQDVTNVLDRIRDRTSWIERIKAKKALKRENNNH